MFIKSCILCGLITIYAAYAAPASYLSTLRDFTQTQCPHYENLTKSAFLDQCSGERPPHLGWKYRSAILCWMYSTVFKHFCISTNSATVYEYEGRNLTKAFQDYSHDPSRKLTKVCDSLLRVSPSGLSADVVKMFNDSGKCSWLCSDFNTEDVVVDECSLTSFMWELTEKYTVQETSVGKVSKQEITNSSAKIGRPAIKSKPSVETELDQYKPTIKVGVNEKKDSTDLDINKNNASINTIVNKTKASIDAHLDSHVEQTKASPHTDLNQLPSPKEGAINTKPDHAHQTYGDKPPIEGPADINPKGSIQVPQTSDNSTSSKDMVTQKDKKNSHKATEHENSGPVIDRDDSKSLPGNSNVSDTKTDEVTSNSVITGEVSHEIKDLNEYTKENTKLDTQKVPKNQEENNIDNLNGKTNPKDTPVDPKKSVIPNVKDQIATSQVIPQYEEKNEEKKVDDIPDTKGDDINLEGDLDDDDPKYEGVDNDEPPLLQKPTKGKSNNAEEDGDEPPVPKYEEVKNKVDVVKPKEIDEDNVNIAANYQNQNIDDSDSYFFSYFMMVCVVFIFGYVAYHNKQKILAMVLEGRRGRRPSRSRRPNSSNYRKLDSTLEEAVTSSCNKNSTQVIY